MTKIYFITFASQKFYNSSERIVNEAKNFNIFDEIIKITDNELKNDIEFWNKHYSFIENNSRGYGYWIWKSYINLKLLEKINDDDIVIYADSGCTLNINGKNRLLQYINIVNKSKYGILSFKLTHYEKKYTKQDLFDHLDIKNIIDEQINATSFIYKKCDHTKKIFKLWYETCCVYNLIDDSKSLKQNHESFIEHRHDQSIFSLIRKNYGTEILEDETYPIGILKNPIWATRKI